MGRGARTLTRQVVLRAAVGLADEVGIEALSMRSLGQVLGVEAMSLYNHVASKDDLLDGMVDTVVAEFDLPDPSGPWKAAIRSSALSAHDVLLRHPWACGMIVTRPKVGRSMLSYMDAVVGVLRSAGLPMQLVHHAVHALDSHVFGFTLQELNFPMDIEGFGPEMAAIFLQQRTDEYPHLSALIVEAEHDDKAEFTFLLDLILDGLERERDAR
jgi:AcrR family transcriptional regulator